MIDRRTFLRDSGLALGGLTLGTASSAESVPSGFSGAGSPSENDRLAWWRDARFGMFVHWGPVSLRGTEISWSRADRGPVRSGSGSIPTEEYDRLHRRFNPTEFDPDRWVRLAQEAGMKYLVFTTKHHAGFCMFESPLTDHDIGSTPYEGDICRELADACHRAGLPLGWYHSQPDWHHPHFMTTRHTEYQAYLHRQVRHLLTDYGPIDILWFDGLGHPPEDWDARNLFEQVRSVRPEILINDRAGLPGDFDTPEQEVGTFQTERSWESCITIGTQWAWKPDDEIKSLRQCIQTLVLCACGDGNLLFNVGPRPDGRIDPQQAGRLREMGEWLEEYGESIYGTRGGPFKPATIAEPEGDFSYSVDAVWASTHRDRRIYVHVLNWPGESVALPPLDNRIERASLLTGGTVEMDQSRAGIYLTVPQAHRRKIDTIVALDVADPIEM